MEITDKRFSITLASLTVLFVLMIAGCGSGDPSRSQINSLVEHSPEFVQPLTIDLTNQYEVKPSFTGRASAAETVEQAKERDLETFLESYPEVDVAHRLGFAGIEQALVKEDPYVSGTMSVPGWYLTRKVRASEKGKALWQAMNLPVRDDALPIGSKEFGEVTGIAKQGETQAVADFTYRWEANELGKALDEKTTEFKELPEELRKRLTQKKGLFQTSDSMDWSGERQGKALLQKYDDGWRLVKIF